MKSALAALKAHSLSEKLAVAAVIAFFTLSGILAFGQIGLLRVHTTRLQQTLPSIELLHSIELTLKSADSEHRGFLITRHESYLVAFHDAKKTLATQLSQLATLAVEDPEILQHVEILQPLAGQMIEEFGAAIEVHRVNDPDPNQAINSPVDRERSMDAVKATLDQLQEIESRRMREHEVAAATAYSSALLTSLCLTIASLISVAGVLYLVQRNRQRAELVAAKIQSEHERLQASLDRNTLLEIENQRMNLYMRTFVEQVQDYAIFGMDEQCRATTWNEGVKHVLGFSEEEFVGHDIRQLIFTPEAIEIGVPAAEFEVAAKEGRASDDRWMMRKCGKRFWASGITSAVKDESNKLIGFSKVMRDLTEHKRDEDQLAELAAKLGEADRRKNEFLATLAHELRNPLAPIKNAVELMAMSELSAENQELREIIARQVEQVIRLIDDLLDVSRISHGKLILKKSVVDLRKVIESAVEASGTFIREKSQNLQVLIGEQPALVHGDPTRLAQVFSNLLNNSSRYSDENCNISVTLTIKPIADQCGAVEVVVRDNGIGIARDRLGEIFQMFSQVHDSLERGKAGLGIGLTLVKTLVELHGGKIDAESPGLGKGSTFTVSLPLAPLDSAIEQEPSQPKQTSLIARSFKVLVVEDMRALRLIMSRLLEKLGHEVRVAEDGLEALDVLSAFDAEVVFSDIAMPGMTGYDFARKLRQLPDFNQTYLVAMTGYGQLSDRNRSRESGFNEHIVKPVELDKLRELFDRLTTSRLPKQ